MSDLMLDVGQANELKLAFRRAGYDASQIKSLCEGDILAQVRKVLLGNARIVPVEITSIRLIKLFTPRKDVYVSQAFISRFPEFARESDTSDISKCNYIDLPENMTDSSIIERLGGVEQAKKKALTFLQLWEYLNRQKYNEEGVLRIKGTNIFYMLDKNGELFTVTVYPYAGKWVLSDYRNDGRGTWPHGYRVFYNSL